MKEGQVRIIGGKWRGRKLKVLDVKELRPTPDRVRETLFNWLAPMITGARCLDLFAGTGVLGFEALSRGAAYAEMIDQSPVIIQLLKEEQQMLNAEHANITQASIPGQLTKPSQPFNIVFLDPPYLANAIPPTCSYLEKNEFLADIAHIYLEANRRIEDNDLPSNWHIIKSQQAGQVYYHLARRERA